MGPWCTVSFDHMESILCYRPLNSVLKGAAFQTVVFWTDQISCNSEFEIILYIMMYVMSNCIDQRYDIKRIQQAMMICYLFSCKLPVLLVKFNSNFI